MFQTGGLLLPKNKAMRASVLSDVDSPLHLFTVECFFNSPFCSVTHRIEGNTIFFRATRTLVLFCRKTCVQLLLLQSLFIHSCIHVFLLNTGHVFIPSLLHTRHLFSHVFIYPCIHVFFLSTGSLNDEYSYNSLYTVTAHRA